MYRNLTPQDRPEWLEQGQLGIFGLKEGLLGIETAAGTIIALLRGQRHCGSCFFLETVMSDTAGIVELLEAGLRAENLRQRAIASNIANLQTPGYRRIDVRFRELLEKAIKSEGTIDPEKIKMEIYEPQTTTVKANGNDVSLENEIGEMVKNTLRHKTYIRLLNKKYEQMERAISTR